MNDQNRKPDLPLLAIVVGHFLVYVAVMVWIWSWNPQGCYFECNNFNLSRDAAWLFTSGLFATIIGFMFWGDN